MSVTRRQMLALPFAALVAPRRLASRGPRVWAVGDGEKVERGDLRSPLKNGSSVWDGRRIRLFGARNEVIAFQVVLEAGAAGVARARVRLSELKARDGLGRIAYAAPASDPTDTVGRPVQLFSVNYLNVATPTHANWIFAPGSPAAPRSSLGWTPVQLVPENARQGLGGFPVHVPPSRNQAFWIEIYTSRDLPAGVYEGNVEVDADGHTTSVPVELEIFDFTLPDANSMHAMVYFEPAQVLLYQGRDLDAAYHRFAHRHRLELVHAYDVDTARAAADLFDGRAFSPSHGYDGPGRGVGNRIVPRTFYGPEPEFEARETAWRASDEWMTFVAATMPDAITFLYMPDEPGPKEYARIRDIAEYVHSNPGPGRALPTFVTKKYTAEIDGAIDIWDTGPKGFDIARAASERARGRRYWIYNGGRPAAGAIVIDAPATDPRATVWACFKHGIDVYYYWHGVHWQHNRQKVGERRQNVWANPITFDNRGQPNKPADSQGYANGDGVLIYPGTEVIHPTEDRGIQGPISSVQLANFRRGLQDHQYLTLARGLGLTSLVAESLAAVVPRVFSDAGATVGFAEGGDPYERVRYRLAREIARASVRR